MTEQYYPTREVWVEIKDNGDFSYSVYGRHLLVNPVRAIQTNHLSYTTIEIIEGKYKGTVLKP